MGVEIERRAAARGLTLTAVALRMGVSPPRLTTITEHPQITEAMFLRITAALEMTPEDWDRPLRRETTTLQLARRLRRNVTLE